MFFFVFFVGPSSMQKIEPKPSFSNWRQLNQTSSQCIFLLHTLKHIRLTSLIGLVNYDENLVLIYSPNTN